jgi:hypothetical protein
VAGPPDFDLEWRWETWPFTHNVIGFECTQAENHRTAKKLDAQLRRTMAYVDNHSALTARADQLDRNRDLS